MRLASFTDCGLRMLMHVALAPDRAFLTEDLAEEFGLSRNHLAKIMQRLARAGLIETHRGGGAARWSGHRRRSPGRGRHDAAHLGPQLVQCRLEIPYSCDRCRMAMVFGGSIRFSTAALRSGDIPNHHPIPPASEIEKKESSGQLP